MKTKSTLCSSCHGQGIDKFDFYPCEECHGSGHLDPYFTFSFIELSALASKGDSKANFLLDTPF